VPEEIRLCLSSEALSLPDTDWFVPDLYDFVEQKDISSITAHYSRFVVDLNRTPDNENLDPGSTITGICPTVLFNGQAVYQQGREPSDKDIEDRIELF